MREIHSEKYIINWFHSLNINCTNSSKNAVITKHIRLLPTQNSMMLYRKHLWVERVQSETPNCKLVASHSSSAAYRVHDSMWHITTCLSLGSTGLFTSVSQQTQMPWLPVVAITMSVESRKCSFSVVMLWGYSLICSRSLTETSLWSLRLCLRWSNLGTCNRDMGLARYLTQIQYFLLTFPVFVLAIGFKKEQNSLNQLTLAMS